MWIYISSAWTIVNARVPPTPTVASTTAPVPPPPPAPTLNVIELRDVAPTLTNEPANGSELGKLVLDIARGYG